MAEQLVNPNKISSEFLAFRDTCRGLLTSTGNVLKSLWPSEIGYSTSRRRFLHLSVATVAAAALGACNSAKEASPEVYIGMTNTLAEMLTPQEIETIQTAIKYYIDMLGCKAERIDLDYKDLSATQQIGPNNTVLQALESAGPGKINLDVNFISDVYPDELARSAVLRNIILHAMTHAGVGSTILHDNPIHVIEVNMCISANTGATLHLPPPNEAGECEVMTDAEQVSKWPTEGMIEEAIAEAAAYTLDPKFSSTSETYKEFAIFVAYLVNPNAYQSGQMPTLSLEEAKKLVELVHTSKLTEITNILNGNNNIVDLLAKFSRIRNGESADEVIADLSK